MNKKGLSEVVTTVLIILLVLAAIIVIWTYVKPTITNAAKKIGGSSDCLNLDISAQNCKLVKDANNVTTGANVTVKRGTDTSNVTSLIYLFDTTSGNRATVTDNPTLIEPLGMRTITVSKAENITKVTVSAKVTSDAGDVTTCDPSSSAVVCS